MSFGQAISSFFSKYATFSGRARRSELWYAVLFNFIVAIVLGIVDGAMGTSSQGIGLLGGLYSLATLVPSLAIAVRRLHDTGRKGTYLFMSLIPVVGGILVLIRYFEDSQPGANAYGNPVK